MIGHMEQMQKHMESMPGMMGPGMGSPPSPPPAEKKPSDALLRNPGGLLWATRVSDPQELEHHIRQRACELYEAGGKQEGRELDEWLRAEAITGKKAVGPS
jgi:hypothetical protein